MTCCLPASSTHPPLNIATRSVDPPSSFPLAFALPDDPVLAVAIGADFVLTLLRQPFLVFVNVDFFADGISYMLPVSCHADT